MTPKEAVDTLINGNRSDFHEWVVKAKKKAIVDAIEYACDTGCPVFEICEAIRRCL